MLLNISRECFKKLIKLKSLKLVHIIVGIAGEENQWQRVLKQYMFISHLWSLRHKAMNITFDICYLLIYVRGITLWKVKLEKGWNFYMVFLLYEFEHFMVKNYEKHNYTCMRIFIVEWFHMSQCARQKDCSHFTKTNMLFSENFLIISQSNYQRKSVSMTISTSCKAHT